MACLRTSCVSTGLPDASDWNKEVRRCWPSRISRSGWTPASGVVPSTGRSLNRTSPPVRSIISVPAGYPSEMDASRLVMFLSGHTQPR